MFVGEYEYALDDKNRVVLPMALRKKIQEMKLDNRFVLTIGRAARFLELHPLQQWNQWIEQLSLQYNEGNEEAEEFFRDICSSAHELDLDKNYRFLIPEARKQQAGITKEVLFVGNRRTIEIWDRERWQARNSEREGKQGVPRPDKPL